MKASPEQPFEKIVGVARQRPEPALAHASFRRRAFERGELRVGGRFARDGGERRACGEDRRKRTYGRGRRRGQIGRDRKHEARDGLRLKEQKEAQRRARAPFLHQGGVARIMRVMRRSQRDMQREAQRPHGDEPGDQRATGGRRLSEGKRDRGRGADRKRPDHIDPACAGPPADDPGHAHRHDQREGGDRGRAHLSAAPSARARRRDPAQRDRLSSRSGRRSLAFRPRPGGVASRHLPR